MTEADQRWRPWTGDASSPGDASNKGEGQLFKMVVAKKGARLNNVECCFSTRKTFEKRSERTLHTCLLSGEYICKFVIKNAAF